MKYAKPSVVVLAGAAEAIQSGQGVKGGAQADLFTDPVEFTSIAAYEADE